jgi:hypothetical protein
MCVERLVGWAGGEGMNIKKLPTNTENSPSIIRVLLPTNALFIRHIKY